MIFYKKAEKIKENEKILICIANCYLRMKNHEQAYQYYKKAIINNPDIKVM